jgi:hypothetical protein
VFFLYMNRSKFCVCQGGFVGDSEEHGSWVGFGVSIK